MKRNSYGMTHKLKCDIPIGVHVPVLSKELVPGDIVRIEPEILLKAVVPPVTQLTDKFKYSLEFYSTPDRLTDDKFVANMSTTKTGEVKGDFKSFTVQSLIDFYGDAWRNDGSAPHAGSSFLKSNTPRNFPYATQADFDLHGKGNPMYKTTDSDEPLPCDSQGNIDDDDFYFNTFLPMGSKILSSTEGGVTSYSAYVGTEWFGQNSLMDYLGMNLATDIGTGYTGKIRWNHISSYYMIMNFYHTNPEYQLYLAPETDYVYGAMQVDQCGDSRSTLHRYETLEEEFGNGFIQPRLSGRCWRGLVISNWDNGYFSNTTIDAQRGIAPQVPVSLKGSSFVSGYKDGCTSEDLALSVGSSGAPTFRYFSGEVPDDEQGMVAFVSANPKVSPENRGAIDSLGLGGITGSFIISDLRTALALQHFQEDAQGTYKWSDFLLRMFGTAPVDNLQDKPYFIGGISGYMACGEVLSQASTDGAELGEIGGKMSAYDKGKRITYQAKEHCVLQAILTIKPERNFQSGIDRQFTRINYLDMFWKQFVGIGAQAIRADEVTASPYNYYADGVRDSVHTNWGFTDRFEEMKHMRNRVCGGCRSPNSPLGYAIGTLGAPDGHYTLRMAQNDPSSWIGLPNYDKHMYAMGDAYIFDDGGVTGSFATHGNGGAQLYSENCQQFLLCIPQLTDIFISEKDIPFLCTIQFNMDMFRPVPVYTKPGVRYI